jgi:hypothetical protein
MCITIIKEREKKKEKFFYKINESNSKFGVVARTAAIIIYLFVDIIQFPQAIGLSDRVLPETERAVLGATRVYLTVWRELQTMNRPKVSLERLLKISKKKQFFFFLKLLKF